MTGPTRRAVLGGGLAAAACALAPAAMAHTPYRQWVVYRKTHLLIGCHRGDPTAYDLARAVAAELAHHLPTSRARVARAPAASRLASLLATDQLDVAVLGPADARAMRAAEGVFAAYGTIDLRTLAILPDRRALFAHARFPADHTELVTEALVGSPVAPFEAQLGEPPGPWHPAALAARHAPG